MTLSHKRLLEILYYDPATGIFRWREKISKKVVVGEVAGSLAKSGYVRIKLLGHSYAAHVLAVFYITGSMPVNTVDHKDLVRNNNIFANLREATNSENQSNRPMQKNNKCGFKGVRLHKQSGKYQARIGLQKNKIDLGLHDTPEDAHAAYVLAANAYHGQFARSS